MKRLLTASKKLAPIWIVSLAMASCTGDPQSLEEAVEANLLDLASIRVEPPADIIEPVFINSNQRLSFTLSGRNAAGAEVELPASGRRWSVSDPAVASINSDGVLTGRAEGEVDVSVRVSDVIAASYRLTVSNAQLTQIESIGGGETTLERCLPQSYTAVGTFTDGSSRTLSEVEWSVTGQNDARVVNNADGSARLTAQSTGAVTLQASSAGQQFDAALTVSDSLQSLSILPASDLQLGVNASLQLAARGSYQNAEENRSEDITGNIGWAISPGSDVVSVGNTDEDRGLLRGLATGTATVSAACGNVNEDRSVEITGSSSSNSGALAFDQQSPFNITLDGVTRQLTVSADGRDVTDLAEWSVINTGIGNPIVVNNFSTSKGEVTAQATGEATVQATYDGESDTIAVSVTQ
jgi:hypothetical protein